MPGKSIRHLRSASKESTASALRGRTRNLTSTSSLMHLTGNPYLDAERERDNERALLDRSLTYTAAASGKQAASGDEATDVGQASSTRTRDSGKRRAQVSGDQLESPRPSRATSKISNATTSKKMGKGKRKGKMKKVEKVLPMLGPTDDDTEYVINAILKAEFMEWCSDEFQQIQAGWRYTIKWHNFTIEETASESPITWQMCGPRPNNRPISFWLELRKRGLVPPLKNPKKAKAMKKEMFRERRAEEESKKGREKGVKERTEDEWEEWWMTLRDEWEPYGEVGQVFHAPVRVKNKWARESLEDYIDEREILLKVLKQHEAIAEWAKYEETKLTLEQIEKHIENERRIVDDTTEEIVGMNMKLLTIKDDEDEDVAKPANVESAAPAVAAPVQPQTTSDQAIKRGLKRPRHDIDPEDAGTSNLRPAKKVARVNGEKDGSTQARSPTQLESDAWASSNDQTARPGDADQRVRASPPPPLSISQFSSRPTPSSATGFRQKKSLFAGESSDEEGSSSSVDVPLVSIAAKGHVHQPKWEVNPPTAAQSALPYEGQAPEVPQAPTVPPADNLLAVQVSCEPTPRQTNGSQSAVAGTPAESSDAITSLDDSGKRERELWGTPDPEPPSQPVSKSVAREQEFLVIDPTQSLGHPSIDVVPVPAEMITVDTIVKGTSGVHAAPNPQPQVNQRAVVPLGETITKPPSAQPSRQGKATHPLMRTETGFRFFTKDSQATNRLIAHVAVLPDSTSRVQTFASALSALGPSPQDVTFALSVPSYAAAELLTERPFLQTGAVVLSNRLNEEERSHQDKMLQGITAGHTRALFAQLADGLAIVLWHSASQNSGKLNRGSDSPGRLLCALVALEFEHALQELPRPRPVIAKQVLPTVTLEKLRLDELGFTSSFFASLRGLRVVIWADLLLDTLHAPARSSGWILEQYQHGKGAQVVIIENRYVPGLLATQNLKEAVDNGLRVFAVGPDPDGRAPSERLRPILRDRSLGGIVTFPPLFILKEPRLFSEVIEALSDNPLWTAYLLPQVVAAVESRLTKQTCCEPAYVVATMMDMLDVVKIKPRCAETLASRVKHLPLEDDLSLASDWESWVTACRSFPPVTKYEKATRGMDLDITSLENAQVTDLGKIREWPVGADYQFNRVFYVGADCSLLYGSKAHSPVDHVIWQTATAFLAFLS